MLQFPYPAVSSSSHSVYDSRADAEAANIPDSVTTFVTLGFYAGGDGGGAIYIEGDASTPGGFTSAGSRQWELANQVLNVRMFGAKGDNVNNDGPAINAAITRAKHGAPPTVFNSDNPGHTLYMTAGVFLTAQTIVLSAGVILKGEGPMATQIRAANTSNINVIETEGYNILSGSGDGWWESGVPCYFGIRDLVVSGNKFNNTSGSGIRIYGYGYDLTNIIVTDCCDFGIISQRDTPTDTFLRNWTKTIESTLDFVRVWNCDGTGIYWDGPTDAHWGSVFIGECGQKASPHHTGASILKPIDVQLLHIYASGHAAGTNNSIGLNCAANAKFDQLISEHNYGVGVSVNTFYFSANTVQLYRNARLNGTWNFLNSATSVYTQIGDLEIRLDDVNASGASIQGSYCTIGSATIVGTNGDLTIYTGTGFSHSGTAHYLNVASLMVKDLRGSGATGASFNQGGAAKGCKINAMIYGCTTGSSPGSQFGVGQSAFITIEKATAPQAYSAFAWTAATFGTQQIVQISETGTGSYG